MERSALEAYLSEGLSLAEIGRRVGRHEATVAYWLGRYGLRAAHTAKHASRGGLVRQQLEAMVEDGLSIAEIAVASDRSKATVRYWLSRYGLRTGGRGARRRSVDPARAREEGLTSVTMACPRHGDAIHAIDARGHHRCKQCRAARVADRRRRIKETLVAEAGGACALCGYARCVQALSFHHLDPAEKEFGLARHGVTRSLDRARVEAAKCVLLCANCHAEVESGMAALAAAAPE
jgi:transposase